MKMTKSPPKTPHTTEPKIVSTGVAGIRELITAEADFAEDCAIKAAKLGHKEASWRASGRAEAYRHVLAILHT